jgi:hypothetical protein
MTRARSKPPKLSQVRIGRIFAHRHCLVIWLGLGGLVVCV